MRPREGMAVARAKGRLRGRQPKLSSKKQAELRRMHASGGCYRCGGKVAVARRAPSRAITRAEATVAGSTGDGAPQVP